MTKVQTQIARLQQQLEEKEARMHVVGSHALMRQAYDKQLKELQMDVDQLSKERVQLLQASGRGQCGRALAIGGIVAGGIESFKVGVLQAACRR
jgi:hypothetical protein